MALLSGLLLYVIAINVFLSTSLFERVVNGDEVLTVQFERGWSVWPGTIHAQKLWIRSRDSQVEWLLRVDRVTFDITPWPTFTERRVHFTRVEGSGVSFWMRRRVEAPLGTEAYVAALPPVPGFPRVPIRPVSPPDLLERWSDDHYHLLTMQLSNVVADDVREIWIDDTRFEGRARILGGFYLKPIRKVEVGPIDMTFFEGATTNRGVPVIEELRGALGMHLAPIDPRVSSGDDIVRQLTVDTDLAFRVPDLAPLARRFAGEPDPDEEGDTAPRRPVAGGRHASRSAAPEIAGPLVAERFALRLHAGVLDDGTEIKAKTPELRVELDRRRFDANVGLEMTVRRPSPDAALRMESRVALESVALHERASAKAGAALARVKGAVIVSDATKLDITDEPFGDLHSSFDVPSVVVPDLARAQRAFGGLGMRAGSHAHQGTHASGGPDAVAASPAALRIVAGAASGHARGEVWLAERRGKVASGAVATGLVVEGSSIVARGDVAVDVTSDEVVLRDGAADAKVFIERAAVAARSERLTVTRDGSSLVLALRASGHARRFSPSDERVPDGEAKVHASKVTLTVAGAKRPGATAERLDATARWAKVDLSALRADAEVQADVVGGRVSDGAALDMILPADASVGFAVDPAGGSFEASVRAMLKGSVGQAAVNARTTGVGVASRTDSATAPTVWGALSVAALVPSIDLGTMEARTPVVRVVIDRGTVRLGKTPEPALVAGHIEVVAAAQVLSLLRPSLDAVEYRLRLDDARLDDARVVNRFLGSDGSVAIESGRATATASVTVSPQSTGGRGATGTATFALSNAAVRFGKTHLTGDFRVDGKVHAFDATRRALDLAGSHVTMRRVGVKGASAETASWSGDLEFVSAEIQLASTPTFDAFIQLKADDARPILGVALEDALPKFVVGLVEAPHLAGQARLTVGGDLLAVRDLHVSGGDIDLRGSYVARARRRHGAMVVSKGPFSAGVKLDDSGAFVRLWSLDTWMKEESATAAELLAPPRAEARRP